MKGRTSIREATQSFYDTIEGIHHEIHETFDTPETAIVRGRVTYKELDGSTLKVPFANVFKFRGDWIGTYQVYVDNHELSPEH